MCLVKYLLNADRKFFRFASAHFQTLGFSPASLQTSLRYGEDSSSLQLNGTEACIVLGSVYPLRKRSNLTRFSNNF